MQHTAKFPKTQRFLMAKRMEEASLDFYERINQAVRRKDDRAGKALSEADELLSNLKMYNRLYRVQLRATQEANITHCAPAGATPTSQISLQERRAGEKTGTRASLALTVAVSERLKPSDTSDFRRTCPCIPDRSGNRAGEEAWAAGLVPARLPWWGTAAGLRPASKAAAGHAAGSGRSCPSSILGTTAHRVPHTPWLVRRPPLGT